MNLGGNDFANAITSLGFIVAAVALLPALLFHVLPAVAAAVVSLVISTACYGYLAFINFQKGYRKKSWIKVKASPINGEVAGQLNVETTTSVTVGWSFIHEGKQHDVKFRSSDRYTLDREVYWCPDTDEIILRKLKMKFYFCVYSICAVMAFYLAHLAIFVELMGFEEVIPANVWFLLLASPIGVIVYLEYKNR